MSANFVQDKIERPLHLIINWSTKKLCVCLFVRGGFWDQRAHLKSLRLTNSAVREDWVAENNLSKGMSRRSSV